MKIGVISDTHMDKHTSKIEKLIDKSLKDVDLIIHLGDFTSPRVLEKIKKKKKVIGVWGNNDRSGLRQELKEKEIVTLDGYKVGLFHGHGTEKNTLDRVYNIFKDDNVDIILFGHSHQPMIKTKNKTLIINPGSPSKKIRERWFSYVVLTLKKDKIEAKVCFYNK
ncbi:TPA: metallophosphoesterase [Clostridium botulinum]|nr:YfcE family phosphodiesterase [Clostridium sporogenes]AVQ54439.1 metallophosphoesterase [Clostridium botulinum]EJE7236525.1 metallophosphoesterase [Clostridium botulinum]MCW6075840.1 metallophosphoesterase [Clostridium sporogenes]MCW6112077.1 metallophosphoesterase [Clostridium sporogenes]